MTGIFTKQKKMKAMKALPGSSAEADEPKELPAEVDLSELDQEYEKLKKELGK